MSAISLQRLKEVIKIAYEAGYHGCLDLKDVYCEEIVAKLLESPVSPQSTPSLNEGWKIWKIKELKQIPIGSIFEHAEKGTGWISHNATMLWHDGTESKFMSDDVPWTSMMRRVGQIGHKLDRQTSSEPRRIPRRF